MNNSNDVSDIKKLDRPEQDARIGKHATCKGFTGIIESIMICPEGESIQLKNERGGGKGGCNPDEVTILD